jgi:hypothetical protein
MWLDVALEMDTERDVGLKNIGLLCSKYDNHSTFNGQHEREREKTI